MSGFIRVTAVFCRIAPFGTIKFADDVGPQLKMRWRTPSSSYSRANRPLHHHMRALRQSSVLCASREPNRTMGCHYVWLCYSPSALFHDSLVATETVTTILPLVDVCFAAGEADDRELVEVHCVLLEFRLPSRVPGHPKNERPCSQSPPECIPGGLHFDF
jgi:hypothetical protein